MFWGYGVWVSGLKVTKTVLTRPCVAVPCRVTSLEEEVSSSRAVGPVAADEDQSVSSRILLVALIGDIWSLIVGT